MTNAPLATRQPQQRPQTNGTALAQRGPGAQLTTAQQLWNQEQITTLKQFIAKNTTDAQFALFAQVCQRTGLDPFARQVFCVVRQGEMAIQISIDGLRLIAMRSGKYAGTVGPFWRGKEGDWSDVWLDEKPPAAAKVGIWREGFKEPAWAVAMWSEFGSTSSQFWKARPAHMLAKVAESHALRKAFQSEIATAQRDVIHGAGARLELAGNRAADDRLLADQSSGEIIDAELVEPERPAQRDPQPRHTPAPQAQMPARPRAQATTPAPTATQQPERKGPPPSAEFGQALANGDVELPLDEDEGPLPDAPTPDDDVTDVEWGEAPSIDQLWAEYEGLSAEALRRGIGHKGLARSRATATEMADAITDLKRRIEAGK
jgi:phage recombination protein Bet